MTVSASRERKTRQDLRSQGLTEKQIQAQKEEQKARRNTIIYTVLGVVCAAACAALLIWNSGFFQGRAKAVTIGSKSYTSTEVQYYYNSVYQAVYNDAYTYAMYGLNYGYDITKSPKDQVYDAETGKTWHDYFLDSAIQQMTSIQALNAQADAQGYQLSAEGKETVKNQMARLESDAASSGFSTTAYLKANYGKTMTKSLYEKLLTADVRADEFYSNYVDSLSYTDEQIESYYGEHTDDLDLFRYSYASFSGTPDAKQDADGNTVAATDEEKTAAMAEAKRKAEELQAKLTAGDAFEQAAASLEEDSKVTLYPDRTTVGGSLPLIYGEWMQDAARKQGDTHLIENAAGNGYYVIVFEGRERDTGHAVVDVRHVLVAAEQDEGASVPTQEQYDAAKAKAEQLLADWKAGGATEEAFGKLAQENSADTSSAANGGLMTDVSSSSGYVSTFADWALASGRQPGDTGIVQNTGSSIKGWHIMYFVAGKGDENWKTNTQNTLTNADLSSWMGSLTGSLAVTRENGLKNVG